VAFSEKSEKFTPSGPGVAPRGCGEPFSVAKEVGGLVVAVMVLTYQVLVAIPRAWVPRSLEDRLPKMRELPALAPP
jgi:hypothetical protein